MDCVCFACIIKIYPCWIEDLEQGFHCCSVAIALLVLLTLGALLVLPLLLTLGALLVLLVLLTLQVLLVLLVRLVLAFSSALFLPTKVTAACVKSQSLD